MHADVRDSGVYRLIVDATTAAGEPLTLGADFSVRGAYRPQRLPGPTRSVRTDGYRISLDGALMAGRPSTLSIQIHKRGKAITGSVDRAQLVLLRDGDLGYLRETGEVHGSRITFTPTVPSGGDYALFVEFRHGGDRTAEFVLRAGRTQSNDDRASAKHESGR